jgi:hypothetical protein
VRFPRRHKIGANVPVVQVESKPTVPKELLWLLDAPLFIDEVQVEALYDAMLRPELDQTAVALSRSADKQIGGALGGIVPGFGISASASSSKGETSNYRVVSNPYRHLLSLALHYKQNIPERMRVVTYAQVGSVFEVVESDQPVWHDPSFISDVPRALLFLDLPPGTKFIPAAAEVADVAIRPLFEDLGKKFADKSKTDMPEYPGGAPQYAEARQQYWDWYNRNFNETIAMVAVEKAAEGKPLNWIAYRVALPGNDEPFLHLWVSARARYDTGTFAYNFVKRGFKHGLRIVGALKSEPDLNVLAVFEK